MLVLCNPMAREVSVDKGEFAHCVRPGDEHFWHNESAVRGLRRVLTSSASRVNNHDEEKRQGGLENGRKTRSNCFIKFTYPAGAMAGHWHEANENGSSAGAF